MSRISMYDDCTSWILNRLPLKYHDRFTQVVKEDGLIDDCKYMVYFCENWGWGGCSSVPVKSKREAIKFIKESVYYGGFRI